MGSDITVAIPTIRPRNGLLLRAVASVAAQTLPAEALAVANDADHDGVWVTRARAFRMARTRWVASLDDDDEFYPTHLQDLMACAEETGADYVFSYFETDPPGRDMLGHFGRPFDPANPHLTTSTVLLRTDLATQIRLGPPPPEWQAVQDDWMLVTGAVMLGAKIVHLPKRTWTYHLHHQHTSGRPERWA